MALYPTEPIYKCLFCPIIQVESQMLEHLSSVHWDDIAEYALDNHMSELMQELPKGVKVAN